MKKPRATAARATGPSVRAARPEEIDEVRTLFREYAQAIMDCHCFKGFEAEVRGLPGSYGEPKGRLLVGFIGRRIAGCVGIRPVDESTCEMKRLFVRPAFRGKGLGKSLAEAALAEAASAGYGRMVLDTLMTMKEARGLYRKLGFEPAAPYWENPTPGAICLQRALTKT